MASLACSSPANGSAASIKPTIPTNDIVGYYLGATTLFYGITLGLVAVGTWNTYSEVSIKVDREAQVISSLYRDVNHYPEPVRSALTTDLKAVHPRGHRPLLAPFSAKASSPTGSNVYLDTFQDHMLTFEPTTAGQQVLHAEAYKQFNLLVEARRSRLDSVTASLPASLWTMVLLGALVCIGLTLFFDTASLPMHAWMTGLMSGLLGLMIFLVATLDNPFRGKVSVGPGALERVYQQLMK